MKGLVYVILFFVIGGVLLLFAKQNGLPVSLNFFSWNVETSLDIVMVTSFISGGILAALFALVKQVKMSARAYTMKKNIKKLEIEMESLQKKVVELNEEISRLEKETATTIIDPEDESTAGFELQL